MRICLGIAISALSFGCVGSIGERASGDGDGVDGGDTINGRVYKPATGLSVRDVALYQGVRVNLVSNGEEVTDQSNPIVAKAPASIFAYVNTNEDFVPREITARLSVSKVDGSTWQTEVTHEVAGAADDSSPQAPTFTFEVEEGVIQTESGFSVELFEGDDVARSQGPTDGYRFPLEGVSEFGAETTAGAFNLVLVPFRYGADGSNRMPPLDEATIEIYRNYFTAMLPVESLNLTVRDPVDYDRSISSGNGWSTWLDTLVQIRTQDSPPPNTYYYGVAAPASTFAQYCARGCIAGLGYVPGPSESSLRASVGVAFTDDSGIFTAIHEVGHTLGRPHAPCGGPSGVDRNYPYSGASIGEWAYDIIGKVWKDPAEYTDIMGYCDKQWISDYTFDAIFERISHANKTARTFIYNPTDYRVGLVDGDGNVEWRRETTLPRPLSGNDVPLTFVGENLTESSVKAQLVPYDHLPGGTLFVPIPDEAPASVVGTSFKTTTW